MHQRQLLIHKSVVKDLKEIKFPTHKAAPIVKYVWNDEASILANNTSCFNYRKQTGTNIISYHSKGLATDINSLLNPYIKNNKSFPSGAIYNKTKPGTLTETSQVVKELKKRG